MKGTPRDARLSIVAILLATSMPFLPKPAPSAHVEHHHTQRPRTFEVGFITVEMSGPRARLEHDPATQQLEWRWYRPFPTQKVTP